MSEVQAELGLPTHQLITESPTRWGSRQRMIERFLEQEKAVVRVLGSDKKSRHLVPTWQDLDVLESINKAVKPLQEFTDALSGESYVSVSYIKPVLHLFKTSLLQPEEEDAELTKTIKGKIMRYLDDKYSDPVKDELLDMSSLVDPRFRTTYIDPDKVEPVKKRAVAEMMSLPAPANNSTPQQPGTAVQLLRNVFSTVGVLVREDGQQIMWKYIEELHKLQEEGLRLGNKLKMAHIQWRNQKMKVNLAAQLFSSSVADALEYSEKELKYPQFTGSAATVQFLRTIDAAFDVLNSRNPLGRGHKAPIKPATKHRAIGILEEAESLLRGLKMKGKDNKLVPLHATQKKTPICGFIACGRSVIGIYEDLVEQPAAPCRYLLTYKLSQDHLELFFSAIRAHGGYNNNPNVRQFRGAYKRLLVRHQVKKGTGNCLLRDNTTILDSTPANINMARRLGIEPVEEIVTEDDTLANLPDVNHLSEYKEAAFSYIAGFIVKKIELKVTCMPCSHALTSADSASICNFEEQRWPTETITRHHFSVSSYRKMFSAASKCQ
ncbi:hypothetical protein JOQ06_010917 [Pogonophryne albipinna]|uniref:DNA transposase THAP9 n=1 Tax=Pogonophryne albipinna TaxID=1090488 RepID=A0AAD6AYP1_9TELE|nr:hypothetical protein JOQ06_010917 [Pogonophryne albipinna]